MVTVYLVGVFVRKRFRQFMEVNEIKHKEYRGVFTSRFYVSGSRQRHEQIVQFFNVNVRS